MSGMQIQWLCHRQTGIEVFIRYAYLAKWYNIVFFCSLPRYRQRGLNDTHAALFDATQRLQTLF